MRHQFPKPPESEKLCPFCKNLVENEIHFLLTCPTFSTHREQLISIATNTIPSFETFSTEKKIQALMTENTIIKTTAKYIRIAFEVREFLTRPYKRTG